MPKRVYKSKAVKTSKPKAIKKLNVLLVKERVRPKATPKNKPPKPTKPIKIGKMNRPKRPRKAR